jgi:hypothetical protein
LSVSASLFLNIYIFTLKLERTYGSETSASTYNITRYRS